MSRSLVNELKRINQNVFVISKNTPQFVISIFLLVGRRGRRLERVTQLVRKEGIQRDVSLSVFVYISQ